jgi:gamma-glutamyltranspeptidase/glutathione hydrolase
MSRPSFHFHRQAVIGQAGMVASSQRLASSAGVEVLAQGGNAADAAVATAAALSVTEPTSTGLGGDMFALYFESAEGKLFALNGSGRAPAALTLDRLRAEGISKLPAFHPYTVTVPGACAGWCDLLERFGSLRLPEVLAPAIRLAEQGFPVAGITAHFWEQAVERQLSTTWNGLELTIAGRAPRPGETFRNPNLAWVLGRVAEGGQRAFYQGEVADRIVSSLRRAGGCLEAADLAEHASSWEQPIGTNYAGLRLWECPPNSQGLTVLLALNLLSGFDLPQEPLSEQRLHLEIEALRLAFSDSGWYVADPARVSIPTAGLLSEEYSGLRRALIDVHQARPELRRGQPFPGSDTVYFCVVDRRGNACSFINSNYTGFGSGIVPSGCGFSLQNRGLGFSLDPRHPNALAPGKRPYHTLVPAMITRERDGNLVGPLGVMGGFMQPQGQLQLFLALAQGIDPQTALELPRFCIDDGRPDGQVSLEAGMPRRSLTGLQAYGHQVRMVRGWERALFGRGQVILSDPDAPGSWIGGSDPRADGCALAEV